MKKQKQLSPKAMEAFQKFKLASSNNRKCLIKLSYTLDLSIEENVIGEQFELLKSMYAAANGATELHACSVLNACLHQRRAVFILSRDILKDLCEKDKNYKIGLSNKLYPNVLGYLQAHNYIKMIQKGTGRSASVFELSDSFFREQFEAVDFESQRTEAIDFTKQFSKGAAKGAAKGALYLCNNGIMEHCINDSNSSNLKDSQNGLKTVELCNDEEQGHSTVVLQQTVVDDSATDLTSSPVAHPQVSDESLHSNEAATTHNTPEHKNIITPQLRPPPSSSKLKTLSVEGLDVLLKKHSTAAAFESELKAYTYSQTNLFTALFRRITTRAVTVDFVNDLAVMLNYTFTAEQVETLEIRKKLCLDFRQTS